MPDISQWKFITPSSRSRPLSTHYLHRTRPIYSKGINTTASETHFFIPEKTQDKTAQWLNDCIMASALCVDVQTKRRVCFLYLLLSLWKRSGLISFTLEISRLIYRRTSMFALNISRTFVYCLLFISDNISNSPFWNVLLKALRVCCLLDYLNLGFRVRFWVECKWCNSCLACHFQHQYLLLAYNSLATKTVVRHAPHPATRHHPSPPLPPLPSALPSPCIFNESDALEKVLKQGFLLWGLVCVFLVHFEKARGYNILKPPQAHLQRQNTARISCHRSFNQQLGYWRRLFATDVNCSAKNVCREAK